MGLTLKYSHSLENSALVSFDLPEFENLDFYCVEYPIPGISLSDESLIHRGLKHAVLGETLVFNPLNLRFILDEEMQVFLTMFNMLKGYVGFKEKERKLTKVFDIIITITNSMKSKSLFKLKFENCQIIGFDDIAKNNNATDVITQVLGVNFAYTSYDLISCEG